MEPPATLARKRKHVEVCLHHQVEYETRTTGLERFDLPYTALPECSLGDIDTSTTFLGKTLAAPVLIGAMTGGVERAATINRHLAEAAETLGVGFMLGSQRVMLEHPAATATFAVRRYAPTALLIGNLGLAQLNKGYGAAQVVRATELVGADALAFHTNPLQEAMQQGGDTDFAGLVAKLGRVADEVPYPLLLKEVGHGLSGAVARRLTGVKLAALDVAGAGGTSWAKVEEFVNHGEVYHKELAEWGIPTATALREVRAALPKMPLVASGGIRSGVDAAKAVALGAQVVAVARPLLAPAVTSTGAVVAWLSRFIYELQVAMFGVGATTLADLGRVTLRERP